MSLLKRKMNDNMPEAEMPLTHKIAHGVADSIIQKMCGGGTAGYSNGGTMPEDESMEAADDSVLDMLSDEDDGEEEMLHMAEGGEIENNPKLEAAHVEYPKKRILSGVLDRIRAKHGMK